MFSTKTYCQVSTGQSSVLVDDVVLFWKNISLVGAHVVGASPHLPEYMRESFDAERVRAARPVTDAHAVDADVNTSEPLFKTEAINQLDPCQDKLRKTCNKK